MTIESVLYAAKAHTTVAAADDLTVIEALRRGDESAFARLVDFHHASLRRVARLYISDRAVADEVVQETWLGVIQGIWAFEGRSSPKTWIFRILINRAKTRAAGVGVACRSRPPAERHSGELFPLAATRLSFTASSEPTRPARQEIPRHANPRNRPQADAHA